MRNFLMQTVIFFKRIRLRKHFFQHHLSANHNFFHFFLSFPFIFAKYYHYLIKLFYEERNQQFYSHLFCRYTLQSPFKFFWQLLTQTKGIRQEVGKGSSRRFWRFHSTEVLILFDNVSTGRHTRTTRPVVPKAKAGTLRILNDCLCHRSLQITLK